MRLTAVFLAALLASTAQGQLLDPSQPPASSPPVSRANLRARMHFLESSGLDSPDAPDGGAAYQVILWELGYHDLLAEFIERRIEKNERGCAEDPSVWRSLGDAYLSMGPGAGQKAFDAFHKALELDAEDAEARALLGHLLHREGLYDLAAAEYERALAKNPQHILALLGGAALLVRDGAISEASAAIDRLGAAAQPHDVVTRIMLRKALHDFERFGGWLEDTPQNHHAYSRLLYRAGRIMDALFAARRAAELNPGDNAVWNFIALMHLQLGNLEQAKAAYDRSLEANPNQPQIEAARTQIINQMTTRQPVPRP